MNAFIIAILVIASPFLLYIFVYLAGRAWQRGRIDGVFRPSRRDKEFMNGQNQD